MTSILGIDAAWTENEPSGVALVSGDSDQWQVIAAAPSYELFENISRDKEIDWSRGRIRGGPPDIFSLLTAAERLCGEKVKILTLDMPLASVPFHGRREADNAVSREFSGRWCAVHSPTRQRPGALGRKITTALEKQGYTLAVKAPADPDVRYFLEVYPHAALLALLHRERRVPYKTSKSKKYWPHADIEQRRTRLMSELQSIYGRLESVFGSLGFLLPGVQEISSFSFLKRYEDVLDALVCAWVGIRFSAEKTVPFGDATAAVWIPEELVDQVRTPCPQSTRT